jgi:tRNA (Thr-GGU) A37 N-methylase
MDTLHYFQNENKVTSLNGFIIINTILTINSLNKLGYDKYIVISYWVQLMARLVLQVSIMYVMKNESMDVFGIGWKKYWSFQIILQLSLVICTVLIPFKMKDITK